MKCLTFECILGGFIIIIIIILCSFQNVNIQFSSIVSFNILGYLMVPISCTVGSIYNIEDSWLLGSFLDVCGA